MLLQMLDTKKKKKSLQGNIHHPYGEFLRIEYHCLMSNWCLDGGRTPCQRLGDRSSVL